MVIQGAFAQEHSEKDTVWARPPGRQHASSRRHTYGHGRVRRLSVLHHERVAESHTHASSTWARTSSPLSSKATATTTTRHLRQYSRSHRITPPRPPYYHGRGASPVVPSTRSSGTCTWHGHDLGEHIGRAVSRRQEHDARDVPEEVEEEEQPERQRGR